MENKLVSLSELVERIPDGGSIALGGSFLHRGAFAAVRELIRQGKRNLEIIKQSPGYDIDILCRAGAVSKLRAGIVAMEGNFGLAQYYRKAVETGKLVLEEHACMSLTAGLRAAAFGVPFQPCGGLHGSDLPVLNGWHELADPYGSNQKTWVIPAIQPEFAIIQASEVDAAGNVRIAGTYHWDRIMSRAAKRNLIVAERLVDTDSFVAQPELTVIPHFMVEAVAVVEQGAWPGSCHPYYPIDYDAVDAYLADGEAALKTHLQQAPEARSSTHG